MRLVIEYIWLGGDYELRSKTRVLDMKKNEKDEFVINIPQWSYDGSSTNQAINNKSEIILLPRSIFKCPFRRGDNVMVICDTYNADGTPTKTNFRAEAELVFEKDKKASPWFGMEQEFYLYKNKGEDDSKLGHYSNFGHTFNSQGPYYCSVGSNNIFGRDIMEKHLAACMFAGLSISGVNAEVAPCQWEYQIGPVEGIAAGDQLWVSRYILERICEQSDVTVNWDPKPICGDWNGSGCHINYSTKLMRDRKPPGISKTGLDYIHEAVGKLKNKHKEHMEVYGENNECRMTGACETAKFNEFTWGIGSRDTSIRISNDIIKNKKGYFEDRRPASNVDPYRATSALFQTTHLDK